MGLRIWVESDEPAADVRSLLAWLQRDTALRGAVDVVSESTAPGEMGTLSDALSVALGSGGTGVALAGALSIWLRNRGSDIKAIVSGKNGVVTIDVRRAKDPRQVLDSIERITEVR